MQPSKLFIQPPKSEPIVSHFPGISIWLVHSELVLRLYPTKWCLESDPRLSQHEVVENGSLPFLGPVSGWTVRRYTHKPIIEVEGHDCNGDFFRYEIQDATNRVAFRSIKGFPNPFSYEYHKKCAAQIEKDEVSLSRTFLDIGGYKKLLWEKRCDFCFHKSEDMKEILQALIQLFPPEKPLDVFLQEPSMLTRLIHIVEGARTRPAYEELWYLIKGIVEASFSGIFVLKSYDDKYLGYPLPAFPKGMSTSQALKALSYCIHTMIASIEEENTLVFSSAIRTLFPSGRVWHMPLREKTIFLSYEWRKEKPRRVVVCSPSHDMDVLFHTGHKVQECSVRTKTRSSHKKIIQNGGESFHLKAGIEYLYDNFLFT